LLAIYSRIEVVSGLNYWVAANFCIGIAIFFTQQRVSTPTLALLGSWFKVCGLALSFIPTHFF
jgi:hypothetical protein